MGNLNDDLNEDLMVVEESFDEELEAEPYHSKANLHQYGKSKDFDAG